MTQGGESGPAFPGTTSEPNERGVYYPVHHQGMSLRDWFAGQAPEPPESWLHMQRGIDRNRNPHNEPHKPAPRDDFQLTAEWKFAIADAMLRARSNGEG